MLLQVCACNALGPSQWSETIVAHTSKPPPGAPVHVTAAARAVPVPGAGSAAEQRAAGSLSDEAKDEPGRCAYCQADSVADVLRGAAHLSSWVAVLQSSHRTLILL